MGHGGDINLRPATNNGNISYRPTSHRLHSKAKFLEKYFLRLRHGITG